MSIQELIAEGKQRKEENEQRIQEETRRKEEERRKVNEESWSMILEEVAQLMPEELRHVLTAPDYPALSSDSGRYRSQPFVIDLPENTGKIWCNTDTRWDGRNSITFQAMHPIVAWDEFGYQGYYVRHEKWGTEQTDFIVALAEAAEFAEKIPTVQADADAKNAEWLAKEEEPEPTPDHTDWMAEAENYYHQAQDSAIAAALIAIAQELRIFNRSQRGA